MPLSALTGTKLRDRRLAAGLRQAEVAVRAGISASYLNLIEHNRRKVTPEVMARLADALQIDRAALVEGREAALIDDLRTAAARGGAAAETAGGTGAEIERVEDIATFRQRLAQRKGKTVVVIARHGRTLFLVVG